MVVSAAAGVLGGVAGTWSPIEAAVLIGCGLGLLVVAARLAWAGHARAALGVAVAALCGLGAGLGSAADARAWAPPGVDLPTLERDVAEGHRLVIAGTIRHDASVTGSGGVALDVLVDRLALRGTWRDTRIHARVTVTGAQALAQSAGWTRGRRIECPVGSWRRPQPYLNVGVPDAERALSRQGLRVFASVKSAALVDVSGGPWWERAAAAVRSHIRDAVRRSVGDPTSAAVVTAILIGDRTALDAAEVRRLQQAGVYHVVAISGGNVAVWMALVLLVPRAFAARHRVATLWLMLGLMGFALIVDGGASVARAVTVAAAVLAARWWDLRLPAAQALALAGAVHLPGDPLAVQDAGCVLSFAAAATLVWCASLVRSTAPPGPTTRWRRAARGVAMALVATAAIELALLPVSVLWFGTATAAGVVANLLAVPAMAVVQVAGLALAPLALVSTSLAGACGTLAALGVRALRRSADIVVVAPWLVREAPAPSFPLLALYYAALVTGMRAAQVGATARAAAAGLVLVPIVAWVVSGGPERSAPQPWTWPAARTWQSESWPHEPWLLVTTLDVGQGDATVVRFPNGRTWLIDAGGAASEGFDVGERVTSRALWALGHRALARVVMTHAHPDHAAGLPTVLRRLVPRELLTGVPVPDDPIEALVAEAARRAGTRARTLTRGEALSEGGVHVTVLHPERPDWERRRVRNDDSVVLWLRFGAVGVLLPGDVTVEVERSLAATLAAAPLTVWKLAHHGSASSTSAALIEAAAPVVAIASSGRGNRFGHPAAAVVQRLSARGVPLLRTDQVGAIQLATNGRVLLVRTATGASGSVSVTTARRAWWPATPAPSARASRRSATAQPPAVESRPPRTGE